MTPQKTSEYEYSELVPFNGCQFLNESGLYDFGSAFAHSHIFPGYSNVYSFECNAGTGIADAWCPSNEAEFGRLMAFAAMVRWNDSELWANTL